MSDLIDREQAIRMYCKAGCGCEPSECGLTYEQDGAEECGVVRLLKSVPSAEKTGKWLKTGQSWVDPYIFRNYFCPICGLELDKHIRVAPNYCPNCGTRMED